MIYCPMMDDSFLWEWLLLFSLEAAPIIFIIIIIRSSNQHLITLKSWYKMTITSPPPPHCHYYYYDCYIWGSGFSDRPYRFNHQWIMIAMRSEGLPSAFKVAFWKLVSDWCSFLFHVYSFLRKTSNIHLYCCSHSLSYEVLPFRWVDLSKTWILLLCFLT